MKSIDILRRWRSMKLLAGALLIPAHKQGQQAPGASHYLKPVTATNPGITGPIEAQVLSTLPSWLNQKLG